MGRSNCGVLVQLKLFQKRNLYFSKKHIMRMIISVCISFFLFFVLTRGLLLGSKVSNYFFYSENNIKPFMRILFGVLTLGSFCYHFIIGLDFHSPTFYKPKSYLPVKKFCFFFSGLTNSLFGFWTILLFMILSYYLIRLSDQTSVLTIFSAIYLFTQFAMFLSLLNYMFILIIDILIFTKRFIFVRRTLKVIASLLFIALTIGKLSLIEQIQTVDIKIHTIFIESLPFCIVADAFIHLIKNQFNLILIKQLIYLFLINSGLLAVNYWLFLTIFLTDRPYSTSKNRQNNTLLKIDDTLCNIFKLCSLYTTYFIKELLYISRSNRTKGYFILSLMLSFCYCIWFYEENSEYMTYIFVICVAPIAFAKECFYIFSFESTAIKSSFGLPTRTKHFLFLKNLSFYVLVNLNLTFCMGISYLFKKASLTVNTVISSYLTVTYFYFIYCVFIDYLVVKNPKKVDYNTILQKSSVSSNNAILLFLFIILCLPIIFILITIDNLFHSILLQFVLTIMSIMIYGVSLKYLANHLHNERELFIREISR